MFAKATLQIQNNLEKERENGSHVMPISLLFWYGAQDNKRNTFPRLMGQTSRLHNYERGLVSSINQQSRNMPLGKMVCGNTNENKK